MPLTSRKQLEIALLSLTDEAFGYLVVAVYPKSQRVMPWPDGLGGFTPESQAAIKNVYLTASNFFDKQGK